MPDRVYDDFDLLIEPAAEGAYRARVLDSPAGETGAVPITIPFSDLELENFLLRIGQPRRRGVRGIGSPEVSVIRDFGGRLFDAVFHDDLRVALTASLDGVEGTGDRGLRLRLRLNDCPELADLPWEYLYDPRARRYLALSQWTPVVRYLEVPGRIHPLAVTAPLRVLVFASSPTDLDPLDVRAEWDKLRGALAGLQQTGRVELERVSGGTLADLRRQLRHHEYHVLHYVGHGGYDNQAQDGVLALEGPDGRSQPVAGADFGALLHDHRSLRLAVLNSCEGARGGRTDPYAGVAQSLVLQGIPAVVAMQFEITDEAAITFSAALYEAVVDGLPLDAAMADARNAIRDQPNPVEWATPVLYLRAADGRIFDMSDSVAPTASSDPAPAPPLPSASRKPAVDPRKAGSDQHTTSSTTAPAPRPSQSPPTVPSRVVDVVPVPDSGRSEPDSVPAVQVSDQTQFDPPRVVAVFPHDGHAVTSVSFSPDGRLLVSGGLDKKVRIWDREREVGTLKHDAEVLQVIFSPDGTLLASASKDRTARVRKVDTGTELFRCSHQGALVRLGIQTMVFSPDGHSFVSAGDKSGAEVWDVRTARRVARLQHKDAFVECIAVSPDGHQIATAGWDYQVRIWDWAGNQVRALPHKWSTVTNPAVVEFGPGGHLATAAKGTTGYASFWDLNGRQLGHTGGPPGFSFVNLVRWSPDNRVVATLSSGGLLGGTYSPDCRLWRSDTGEPVAELQHEGDVLDVRFSSSGRYLCTASKDGTARVWDSASGQKLLSVDCEAAVNAVDWGRGDTEIACATDASGRLWRISP